VIRLYFDVHVPWPLVAAVRARGVDVLTCQEDRSTTLEDDDLLRRVTNLGRVLVTQDNDFKTLVPEFLGRHEAFCGVLFIRPGSELSQVADHLELVAKAEDPVRLTQGVCYVPL
jgi:hypothetical protein